MTTALTISHELGDDADLLIRPSQWLENMRADLAARISRELEELESVQKAIFIKRQLQQNNSVAVLLQEKDEQGNTRDVAIKVMPLRDAIELLSRPKDDLDRASLSAQFYVWSQDGYDIPSTIEYRRTS